MAATAPPQPVAPSAAETQVDSARSPEKDTTSSKRTSMLEEPAQQAAAQFRVKRILKLNGPFKHGEYLWDDANAPKEGPVVITVDLKAQTLSVFRDGYEIGAAVILYGATDKPSPLGTFPIRQKIADYYSRTYDNAPMPYALRLTQDGVFIHGSDVEWGYGTHGCIGVPTPFAKKLFSVAKLGDIVIVTDGKMLDVSGASVG
ncbi:MAG: L,D-transpeptidase family protein [Sphingobium sp.]